MRSVPPRGVNGFLAFLLKRLIAILETTRYRSCEKNVRLESALVRLARNQVTWGEMGRLRIVEW